MTDPKTLPFSRLVTSLWDYCAGFCHHTVALLSLSLGAALRVGYVHLLLINLSLCLFFFSFFMAV